MDDDRVKGIGKTVSGSIKQVVGKITGDTEKQAEGAAEKVAGKTQNAISGAEDSVATSSKTRPSDRQNNMLPHENNVLHAETQKLDVTGENLVLPLHVEEIIVAKQQIERSVVRVATTTNFVDKIVEEDLIQERVEVERIPIGHCVDVFPPVREEGDLTIMPVVEEVLLVERKYLLKEEVHIRRIRATDRRRETVQLREQEAVITRISSVISNPDVLSDPVQRYPNIHPEDELK